MTNLDPLQQRRGRALTDDQLARWREYVESHVAQEIAAEHEFVIQIVGRALGELPSCSPERPLLGHRAGAWRMALGAEVVVRSHGRADALLMILMRVDLPAPFSPSTA